MLDINELKEVLPETMAKNLKEADIAALARDLGSVETVRTFREGFLGYRNVIGMGKFDLNEYTNAVKFMTYVAMGCTNKDAYAYTFPERMKRYELNNVSEKAVSAYVSGYNRSKLIVEMRKQFAIPVYILNSDVPQKAINRLLTVIEKSKNDLAVVKACEALIVACAPPVDTKLTVDVNIKQDDEFEDMKKRIRDVSSMQRQIIEDGKVSARVVAEHRILEGSAHVIDVD